MVIKERTFRSVYWNLIMVYSQTISLSITIREQSSLKHSIWRETNSRNYVCRVEGSLLYISKIVFRITIQFQNSNLYQWIISFWPNFCQIKRVEWTLFCLFFSHHLDHHCPFWMVTSLNCIEYISLVAFSIASNDFSCFFIGPVFNSLLSSYLEFHPHSFILFVDHTESVATESMHMSVCSWNSSVTHNYCYLVKCLRQ